MLAKRAIGHWVLAPDPFLDALGMKDMRAVEDLPHQLALSELLEADAARVARRIGPLGRQPVDDDLGLVLLSHLFRALPHKLL